MRFQFFVFFFILTFRCRGAVKLKYGKYKKSAKLKGGNDGKAEMAEILIKYRKRKRGKRRKKSEKISLKTKMLKEHLAEIRK